MIFSIITESFPPRRVSGMTGEINGSKHITSPLWVSFSYRKLKMKPASFQIILRFKWYVQIQWKKFLIGGKLHNPLSCIFIQQFKKNSLYSM